MNSYIYTSAIGWQDPSTYPLSKPIHTMACRFIYHINCWDCEPRDETTIRVQDCGLPSTDMGSEGNKTPRVIMTLFHHWILSWLVNFTSAFPTSSIRDVSTNSSAGTRGTDFNHIAHGTQDLSAIIGLFATDSVERYATDFRAGSLCYKLTSQQSTRDCRAPMVPSFRREIPSRIS